MQWLCNIRDAAPLDAALEYASHGWAVFPCAGKVPIVGDGFKQASTDEKQIRAWWTERPRANIGWAICDGLWVLDVDVGKGGAESLRDLERKHGPLPFTTRATTGSGGAHWIFRVPDGVRIRQGAGFAQGIDTRVGGKGYIIVGPSLHPDTGQRYRWHTVAEPLVAPAWLTEMVRAHVVERKKYKPPERVSAAHLTKRRRYAEAVLRGVIKDLLEAVPGGKSGTGRNDRLFKAWRRLAAYADVLDAGEVRRELTDAAVCVGLSEIEIGKVLR